MLLRSHEATRYAWVDSMMSADGRDTLAEVKRIPMRKPAGEYNAGNKTARSEGTSH